MAGPPKPPRMAEEKANKTEEKKCEPLEKRKAPAPPVIQTSDVDSGRKAEQQSVKRKAPLPPSKLSDPESEVLKPRSTKDIEGKESTPAHPSKRERRPSVDVLSKKDQAKQPKLDEASSADSSDSENVTGRHRSKRGGLSNTTVVVAKAPADDNTGDQPTPKPRKRIQTAGNSNKDMEVDVKPDENGKKEERQGPAKKAKKSDVIVASAQIVNDNAEQKSDKKRVRKQKGNEPVVIQACVVESKPVNKSSHPTTVVKAVPCTEKESAPQRTKVTSISSTKSRAEEVEKVCDAIIEAVAVGRKEMKDAKGSVHKKKEDVPFKVPERKNGKPQFKAPEKCLDESMFDLNETVNLNDVNIHEITFNFDFSKFDQELQENREDGLKMSYQEKCKQVRDALG